MRKKKQIRLLIILLLLLALSVIGYLAAAGYSKKEEAEETESEEDAIALYPSGFDVENLSTLSYQFKGKTLTFKEKDGTWYYKKDMDFPVDQSALTGMDSALSDLSASRKITDDLTNAAEYGLEDPVNQITLKDTSGNSFTIYVGNDNESAGITYIYTSEEKAVYTVDSEFASYFTNSLLTLMSMEEFPLPDGTETFQTIRLNSAPGTLTIKQLSAIDYSTDYLGLMGYRACDTRSGTTENYGVEGEQLEELSTALQELSPVACVSYKAGKTQLKKYGLDSPAYTLKLDYTQREVVEEDTDSEDQGTDEESADQVTDEESADQVTDEESAESEESETQYENVSYHQTIYIGVKDGDSLENAEHYYVTWEGTDNIYETDASSWTGILDLEKTDLTCMTPMDFQEDELKTLEITYQGKTYSYENTILNEDSDSSDTDADDTEDEDDGFDNIAGDLEIIQAEDFYPSEEKAPQASEDTLTIKVTLDRKKRNTLTITLTPYDSNYYALMVDGDPMYLINKTDVTGLINDLSQE